MAGYSGTPLWKKLGYKPGMNAFVDGAPGKYRAMLALPADVEVNWLARRGTGTDLVHVFVTSAKQLGTALDDYRERIAPGGMVWVSWPKRSSGVPTDVTEDVVRRVALPLGLVDVKVCAVDEAWSGLKLVIRKKLRFGDAY